MPATGQDKESQGDNEMEHVPVLLREVIAFFDPRPNSVYIDATVGDGGHARALLEANQPNGQVLGLDQDQQQLAIAAQRLSSFGDRCILVHSRFSRLQEVAKSHGITSIDGILFDLGISSRQLATRSYGLSFDDEPPLDMRLGQSSSQPTAADFLNRASEREIADVLFRYGDRHNSRTLARKILNYRRKQAFRVAHDVKSALDLWYPSQLAPIFQALRIWVNSEFEELEIALPQAVDLLKSGGKLAIITFHSGEDRIVKQFLRAHRESLEVPTSIIRPERTEVQSNPRSRSSLLRRATKK